MESRSLKLKCLLAIDLSDLLYNYISKSEIIFISKKKKKKKSSIQFLVSSRSLKSWSRHDEWNRMENNVVFEELIKENWREI